MKDKAGGVVREGTALRSCLHYLVSILGGGGLTFCCNEDGSPGAVPGPRVPGSRRPRHGPRLFPLPLDWRSQGLLTHVRVSPRG